MVLSFTFGKLSASFVALQPSGPHLDLRVCTVILFSIFDILAAILEAYVHATAFRSHLEQCSER